MKIKAKNGYNIIINDLNIALSSNGKIIEVDEEQFNNSIDAKQLNKFIEIVNDENRIKNTNTSKKTNTLAANKVADQAFVIGSDNNKSIENAILMDPNNTIKQSIKKATKVNDATVIAENKPVENKQVENTTAAKIIDTSSAKIIDTNNANTEKATNIESTDSSKQLVKKANKKSEVKNNKVEDNIDKKDQNKL